MNILAKDRGVGEQAQVPVPCGGRQQDRPLHPLRDARGRYTHQGSLG